MTSSDSNDGAWEPPDESQRVRRMSLRRKVSLKFKEFQGFVNEYSENVSTGGMFIRTPSPQPEGTVFDFEFTLGDDFTLIHGIGEVAWTREADEGFDRPAGMGIHFLNLDPDSRKLIDRMVKERLDREALRAAPPPAEAERPWGDLSPPSAAVWDDDVAAAGEEPGSGGERAPGGGADRPPLLFPSEDAAEQPDPFPRRQGPSPYAYARSYRGAGVAAKRRGGRPLLVGLLAIALVVAALSAFFLFFPETAVNLLVPGDGDEARVADARRPGPADGSREGVPVAPVPRAEAEGVLDAVPDVTVEGSAPGPDEAASEGEAEDSELGFFQPAPGGPAGSTETAPPGRPAAPAPVPPAPAPPPASAPATPPDGGARPSAAPISRVLNVVWEERGAELLVTVFLDGVIEEWDYSTVRLDSPPRDVVRIDGVDHPFPRTEIPVGNGMLERIRVGFHPEGRTSQIHVVLDLASADVQVDRTEAAGSELRIYLARGDAGGDGGDA